MLDIPQCIAQKFAIILKTAKAMSRMVGMTVIGPINLIRNPTIPVNPKNAWIHPAAIKDPESCK